MIAVYPLWILATLYFAAGLVLLMHWKSTWATDSHALVYMCLSGSPMLVAQSLLMLARNSEAAQWAYSLFLPIVFIFEVGALDAIVALFGMRKPAWFWIVWRAAFTFLPVSLLFHSVIYPQFAPVPDGYWFRAASPKVLFTGLKLAIYGGMPLLLTGLLAKGLSRQGHRRRGYLVLLMVALICIANDSIIAQHYHTYYPSAWIAYGGLLFLLGRELYWHIQETYQSLNQDTLTGAFSRSYGERYLEQLSRTTAATLVYADLDDFKQINDRCGHDAGDHVLRRFVEVVKSVARPPQAVIRLGGDEFVLVFSDPTSEHPDALRERLYQTLCTELVWPAVPDAASAPRRPVGVSLGWAQATGQQPWPDVLRKADRSMYHEKRRHRRVHTVDAPRIRASEILPTKPSEGSARDHREGRTGRRDVGDAPGCLDAATPRESGTH